MTRKYAWLLAAALAAAAGRPAAADFAAGTRVPAGTTSGQSIIWSTAANGGLGGYVLTTPAGGTVTSVGFTPASIFSISGSPVTTSGTIAETLASETANTLLAAPNGTSGTPTFRTLVPADLASGASSNYVLYDNAGALGWEAASGGGGSGTVTSVGLSLPSIFTVSGSPVTTSGTLSASFASQAANTVLAAPNGSSGALSARALVSADLPQNMTLTASSGNPLTLGSSGGFLHLSGTTQISMDVFGGSGNLFFGNYGSTSNPVYGFSKSGTALFEIAYNGNVRLGENTLFTTPAATVELDCNGLGEDIIAASGQTSDLVELSSSTGNVLLKGDKAGRLGSFNNGATPTISAGADASAAAVATGSSDMAGNVTETAVASPTSATALCTVTFNTAFSAAPKVVLLQATNSATAALQLYVSGTSTTAFTVYANVAPGASASLAFSYLVIQ